MPIYEYECRACGAISAFLVMKPADARGLRCKACEAKKLTRVLSRVRHHVTESQRLEGYDASAPKDERYYKDPRNVGLHAKKRLKALGADLGEAFEEKVEKARTKKLHDL